ncbi:MAG: LytR C-terminal domain-containing protein, partial [Eubacteriales bacterium]|nr:LytR C-terminal domain-containing protein [Eubacteriales bacterium]
MAKRQFYGQEKNPLKMVLYIAIVLVMAGCIGYLVCSSRQRSQEYTEKVQRAVASETEYVVEERHSETETETSAEMETENDTTPVTEMSVTEETVKASSILVLNGTGKSGVAGYWKAQLEEAGYTNVSPASYTGTVGEETIIYVSAKEQAEPLKQQFPNASVE